MSVPADHSESHEPADIPASGSPIEAAAARTFEQHVNNSVTKTYKPVMDDAERGSRPKNIAVGAVRACRIV